MLFSLPDGLELIARQELCHIKQQADDDIKADFL